MKRNTDSTGAIPSGQTGLMPCPFCGGEAEVVRKGNARWSSIVKCTDCGCRLESNENDWNTGEFWNTRSPKDKETL